jgi:hypothetical protein
MTNDVDKKERAVRSEARGPHWIAWIENAAGKPEQSVVLVGLTKEEAEDRARRWLEEQTGPSV